MTTADGPAVQGVLDRSGNRIGRIAAMQAEDAHKLTDSP